MSTDTSTSAPATLLEALAPGAPPSLPDALIFIHDRLNHRFDVTKREGESLA
jgi:hypothetical protein